MSRALLRASLATAAAAVLALGVVAKTQSAYAFTPHPSGQVGAVQVPAAQGAYTGSGWATVTFPQRYVWRTPGSAGTQLITVTYYVWKYSPTTASWAYYNSHTLQAQVDPAGVGAWFSGWYFPVPLDSFAMNVDVSWKVLDGTLVGRTHIDYNMASDLQCVTPSTCSILRRGDLGAFVYLHPAPQPTVQQQPASNPTSTGSTFSFGNPLPSVTTSNGTTAATSNGSSFDVGGYNPLNHLADIHLKDLDLDSFGMGSSAPPFTNVRINAGTALDVTRSTGILIG